jgi:hypothetical protein
MVTEEKIANAEKRIKELQKLIDYWLQQKNGRN